MARPKPIVLLTHKEYHRTEEILEAVNSYTVLYKGQPFGIKLSYEFVYNFKYGRTFFINEAHAIKLADRLNKQFNVDDFTVEVK